MNPVTNYANQIIAERHSVYIPRIHNKYDNDAICHIFSQLYGLVTRIDNVSVKTPEGIDANFHSAFIYYFPFARPRIDLKKILETEKTTVRVNPNINTQYMRVKYNQSNPKIRNNEYWLILTNNNIVENTLFTMEQLLEKMDALEEKVIDIEEESASLKVYIEFYKEIDAKNKGKITKDTTINIHQLARNIELMEERIAKQIVACEEV
jgi:hypothetical protein